MAKLTVDDALGERSPGRLLRRIHKLLLKRMEERFEDLGQSFEDWMAMKMIHDRQVENAGDLAREFGIGTGATTRVIDRLETQGFVERDWTRKDRRVTLLRLTPEGQKAYRAKMPEMLGCWNDWLKDFKKVELDQLTALLAKLETALDEDSD